MGCISIHNIYNSNLWSSSLFYCGSLSIHLLGITAHANTIAMRSLKRNILFAKYGVLVSAILAVCLAIYGSITFKFDYVIFGFILLVVSLVYMNILIYTIKVHEAIVKIQSLKSEQ